MAVGLAGGAAALLTLGLAAALVFCAGVAGIAAYGLAYRRRVAKWLTVAAALFGLLAGGVYISSYVGDGDGTMRLRAVREPWPTDVAAASEPEGFFPPRAGLRCNFAPTCVTGDTPSLNALVFGDSGFPQGVADERRFLGARVVKEPGTHLLEDLRAARDPLAVRPGDTIEVSGVIDNAGAPGSTTATAHNVRALILLPAGSGTSHTVLSSVSASDAVPTGVSDSVGVMSTMPVYLRYRLGSASITHHDLAGYKLPDQLVNLYSPDRLDRRQLAGRGVAVGCQRPDGRLPGGRACAVEFHAFFDVRYAATSTTVNGISGVDDAPFETAGRVHGRGEVQLYWAPRWGAFSDLFIKGGSETLVDCAAYGPGGTWYHVPDAASHPRHPELGLDTAFIAAKDITITRGFVSECTGAPQPNQWGD